MANTVIQVADGSIVPVNESLSEVVAGRDAAVRDDTLATFFVGDTQIALNPSYIILVGDFKDVGSFRAAIAGPEPQPGI